MKVRISAGDQSVRERGGGCGKRLSGTVQGEYSGIPQLASREAEVYWAVPPSNSPGWRKTQNKVFSCPRSGGACAPPPTDRARPAQSEL